LIALAIAGIVFLPFAIIIADALNSSISPFPNANLSGGDLDSLDANPWAMVAAEPFCETEAIRMLLSLTNVLFSIVVCLPLLLAVVTAGLYQPCYEIMSNLVYPLIHFIFQVVMTVLMIIWLAAFAGTIGEDYAKEVFNTIYGFMVEVNNLVLVGYLDLIIIGIITVVGAKSLSAALGGEWYMAGIQRLV